MELEKKNPSEGRSEFSEEDSQFFMSKLQIQPLLYAWGKNSHGELSLSDQIIQLPKAIRFKHLIHQISSRQNHSALITNEGKLYVTGSNQFNKLGLLHSPLSPNKKSSKPLPGNKILSGVKNFTCLPRLADQKVKEVVCGNQYTLALLQSGKVYSWGGSLWGKKGHNQSNQEIGQYINVTQSVVSIACSQFYSLVLTQQGQIYTAGSIGKQISNQTQTKIEIKQKIPSKIHFQNKVRIKLISCGNQHTMAVSQSNVLYSWGDGSFGQLGYKINFSSIPKKVLIKLYPESENYRLYYEEKKENQKIQQIKKISLGGNHSLVLTNLGLFVCGYNQQGQLGLGHTKQTSQLKYTNQFEERNIIDIAAGQNHSILLTDNKDIYTCGYGKFGQLGAAKTLEKITQSVCFWTHVKALAGKNIKSIFAGGHHSWCILDQNNPIIEKYREPDMVRSRKKKLYKSDKNPNLYQIQVVFTDVAMHHRFAKFRLKQQCQHLAQLVQYYLTRLKEEQTNSLVQTCFKQDEDIYEDEIIVTKADPLSYTLMLVSNCHQYAMYQEFREKQKHKTDIGYLIILNQNDLKVGGGIPEYNYWYFLFIEMFGELLASAKFLVLRPPIY